MPTLTIEDYGVIGNYTSGALVSRLGAIDWCCFPYLDSPSHFAAILDQGVGGKFQISPHGDFRSEQRYHSRSLVLETVFETPRGRGILTDWMPLQGSSSSESIIYRQIDVIEGSVTWVLNLDPRFDYGESTTEVELHGARESENSRPGFWSRKRLLFRGQLPGQIAQLFSSIDLEFNIRKQSAEARFQISTGESALFSWAWGRRADAPSFFSYKETADTWRKLAHQCNSTGTSTGSAMGTAVSAVGAAAGASPIPSSSKTPGLTSGCLFGGPWHDSVVRAGLFLKLLIAPYAGSVAESLTTSITGNGRTSADPSAESDTQTWDYRYAWIRNSAFVLQSLSAIGMRNEARNYFSWLSEIVIRDGVEMLQPVYTLDGGRLLAEREIAHLKGFNQATPVRVGNDSHSRFHLDIYGHALLAADFFQREFGALPENLWTHLSEIADFVCGAWRRPDHGPWELPGKPEHFVASKAMCWAALNCASNIAKRLGESVPPRWTEEMSILHKTICMQGFDVSLNSFVSSFGSSEVDSSSLILPLIGFLPIEDPKIQGTLDAVRNYLSDGVLVHRFRPSSGGKIPEAPHLWSSFLYVTNLALASRLDDATDRMAELCSFASHLGFFGEQVNPALQETAGNFPSATAHLSLITAALYIGAARGRELPVHGLMGMLEPVRGKTRKAA
jgi:GH15 family glucan-1,4-alpha-glucosidase